MLSRFPRDTPRPSFLTFLYARELAEAGEFKQAIALFENQYFEDSEGGADVRQVYLEVKLRQALSSARSGDCKQAEATISAATQPVASIAFTSDNLRQLLNRSNALQALQSEIRGFCPAIH
jgi:hypothetical protein